MVSIKARLWQGALIATGLLALGALTWTTIDPTIILDGPAPNASQAELTNYSNERNNVRTVAAALFIGIGSLGTLATALYNMKTAARSASAAERTHIAERFSKAIDHIGSDSVETSLGGIYSLEQVVLEANSRADQTAVVEILSAFVRRRLGADGMPYSVLDNPRTDRLDIAVQAAITVLGRLPFRTDAPRADLSRCQLDMAELSNGDFRTANLSKTTFYQSNLEGANLLGANLSEAIFRRANLEQCTLSSDEQPAILDVGEFSGARLGGIDLTAAELYRARFKDAHLSGAILTRAKICNSDFDGCLLTGTQNLHLGRMEVLDSDMLTPAYGPAVVYGADLRDAKGLTQDILERLRGDQRTKISPSFARPTSWRNR